MKQESIFALTSLSPAPNRVEVQRLALQSWREAGLQVRSFNHPSEITRLAALYPAEYVPQETTSIREFGRHCIPIHAMLQWAAAQNAPILIINSDIELRLAAWELKRMRRLADGGIGCFIRYNHDGNRTRASREPSGIDAFLLHSRDAALFAESSLSMGQPYWDYWLPYTMAINGRPLFVVEHPVTFHRNHSQQWSWEAWHRCALEFDRVVTALGEDRSFKACMAMASRVRQFIQRESAVIPPQPGAIRPWVERTFSYPGSKTFLELGAHTGSDTTWMAAIPGVTLHAFEPDPRNHPPALANVTPHRAAIAGRDGSAPFILSKHGWGMEWTYSSSIKPPKNHLQHYPVTFGESIEVQAVTLDSVCREWGLGAIDFIWADIQGAEAEMIRGGRKTLERTRYLYTAYSDEEMYENQATLPEILEKLAGFRVAELWPEDVLLENRLLAGASADGRRAHDPHF
jgi:FkbM family methyltransferase